MPRRPRHRLVVPCLLALALLLVAAPRHLPASPTSGDCLTCHGTPIDGIPHVDAARYQSSVHNAFSCDTCHPNVTEYPHPAPVEKLACDTCHGTIGTEYGNSVHGRAQVGGVAEAARCESCHGSVHNVLATDDPQSPVYHLNLPRTCGTCHGDPELARRNRIPVENAYQLYMDSIHGRAVMKSGLLVAANCSDCHGVHDITPHQDPSSHIHRQNIVKTCGTCHAGVAATFQQSVHGSGLSATGEATPVCTNCHRGHMITRVGSKAWKLSIIEGCGDCHVEALATYRHSYHGKVTALGYTAVARCSDCHGYHQILPIDDPASTLSATHRLATCQQCHPKATAGFAQFLPHADYTRPDRNPGLYYVYKGFNVLLILTFATWGLHALLWLTRSLIERRRLKQLDPARFARRTVGRPEKYYWRFDLYHRMTHALIIISFLGLASTGLPLKFSDRPWAIWLAHVFGGFEIAGFIHRTCAIMTFGYCIMHLAFLVRRLVKEKDYHILWGPDSLVPQWHDAVQMWQQLQWFFGLGPQPQWGRWTYWEKFDYWAVFWGIAIIGSSGIILWFPTFFTTFLPGWVINVATIIHSDEALLAVGFIFTIHFFNGHLRPDKFPMDPVMFTGRITEEELAHEKPAQYALLKARGELEQLAARPPDRWLRNFAKIFGFTALAIGLILIILIALVH
ncbi:MAG: hypothetical protein HYV02_07985 [Deltaproteobacteria bacterium]|nr:hypothetical protein [Deltaproteobacteria bacterium]